MYPIKIPGSSVFFLTSATDPTLYKANEEEAQRLDRELTNGAMKIKTEVYKRLQTTVYKLKKGMNLG